MKTKKGKDKFLLENLFMSKRLYNLKKKKHTLLYKNLTMNYYKKSIKP